MNSYKTRSCHVKLNELETLAFKPVFTKGATFKVHFKNNMFKIFEKNMSVSQR